MTDVLITGITGMRNRGVEAIIDPTIRELRTRNREIDICLLTRSLDYDQMRLNGLGVKLKSEKDCLKVPNYSAKRRLTSKVFPFLKLTSLQTSSSVINETKVLLASGGDIFSPEYPISPHLKPLEIALELGKEVLFLAQSISPYKTDEQAESFLNVARHSKLITVREKLTYSYLTEILGLSEDIVKLTADPAFLLDPLEKLKAEAILRSYGVSLEKRLIAIAPSQGICKFGRDLDYERHLSAWETVIRYLIEELSVEVLIIPHVQEIWPNNNDQILATQILRKLNFDPRVHLIGGDYSASEYKGIISLCELVIAERMHAAIAGLSSAVCTIAVSYSVKAEGILLEVLDDPHLVKSLLISVEEFLDFQVLEDYILPTWENRKKVSQHIHEKLISVRSQAAKNFDLISKLIKE